MREEDLVSDRELVKVITDFLEMGHVENIIAMYKQQPRYYELLDLLLTDERFAVRLGVAVVMEELQTLRPEETRRALPALARAIKHNSPMVRGEAANILSIIKSPEALALVGSLIDDPSAQVREIVLDIMEQDG
ncbi:MAG: HEAT repeat domain-containing protein [Desulfobulbaceae bacterium]|nr:HEAT repeat domain-containing protein [Desulfobulbaceae bacterium]